MKNKLILLCACILLFNSSLMSMSGRNESSSWPRVFAAGCGVGLAAGGLFLYIFSKKVIEPYYIEVQKKDRKIISELEGMVLEGAAHMRTAASTIYDLQHKVALLKITDDPNGEKKKQLEERRLLQALEMSGLCPSLNKTA